MRPVFFLDRAVGGLIFPTVLREAGIAVERHADHFPMDAPDEEWLPAVAARGWYAVSNDRRIYQNPAQREIVIATGLGYFVLPGGHRPARELAENFVELYPAVERFIQNHERPFIASVARPPGPGKRGRVELLHPHPEREAA